MTRISYFDTNLVHRTNLIGELMCVAVIRCTNLVLIKLLKILHWPRIIFILGYDICHKYGISDKSRENKDLI